MKNQKSKSYPVPKRSFWCGAKIPRSNPFGMLRGRQNSFTLVEVLVGTSLVLIVFLGIFGAYQLGLKVVGLSKNKIVATAIANEWIEKIRNLPYESVGTKGAALPFAVGILDSETTTIGDNVEYKIEIQVKFIVDEADGIGTDDSCNWDYKRAEVRVSWSGRFAGEVKLVTDISPKDKVQEIATCQAQPGGILSVRVFDAYGKWEEERGAPLIEVFDPQTGQRIDYATPSDGKRDFPLATSTYKVVVSKDGFSREETFASGESHQGKTIITPEEPNPIVLLGQITEISFAIDRLSSFSVNTLSPWGSDSFSDSFLNESKIFEKSNVVVSSGQVSLATSDEEYLPSGYLFSIASSPTNLIKWDKFSFSDSEPENTDLKYQIYYASGTDWILIPDTDLPGNSIGLDESPVDLSNLATTTYSQLKLNANFSTNSTTTTPTLYDWQVFWITLEPTPIANANFNLAGSKIVGLDSNDNPIYKYSATTSSNSVGHKDIPDLEWDNYIFSVDPATGLDLISTDPSPQPIALAPAATQSVELYLKAENSLLATVQNTETLEPVFAATITLSNSALGYSQTQYTNEKGQTLFIPLQSASYNLEVSAPGYSPTSTTVSVSGDVTKTIKLTQIE